MLRTVVQGIVSATWKIRRNVYWDTLHPRILCPQSQDGRLEVRGHPGKSVLTINSVRLADLGRFDCEALSRIGGHQKSMFLDIECKWLFDIPLFPAWLFPDSDRSSPPSAALIFSNISSCKQEHDAGATVTDKTDVHCAIVNHVLFFQFFPTVLFLGSLFRFCCTLLGKNAF